MFCKNLKLINYRNFENLDCNFSSRLNIFLGDNGQGKTNLLESIYVSLTGQSFRYSDNESLIKENASEAGIILKLEDSDLDYDIRTHILKSKKKSFLHAKPITISDLRKKFGLVLFSPESLNSIKEGSDQRRDLVDDLLITYENKNSDLISQFRKAMKTRNRILKNYVEQQDTREHTEKLLESLHPLYFDLATRYTWQRIEALKALLDEFNRTMKFISKNSAVDISVEYVVSGENFMQKTMENLIDAINKRLIELHEAELSSGVSLVGPHKHDIDFLYAGKDSRIFCSQGQQRAIILAFKIAQIVYHRKVHGVYPLLLLDDVLSELDQGKREALISFLHEINTQTFLTTTDITLPESFNLSEISVFNVSNGEIQG